MLRSYLAITTIGLVVSACATVSTKSTGGKYSEDLSRYRPAIETVEVPLVVEDSVMVSENIGEGNAEAVDVNQELKATLDSLAVYKRQTVKYIDGFTIQVYGGSSRNDAREMRMKVLRYFPETSPAMIFDQPNYKVRLGQYYTRLDAQPLFIDIRKRFSTAILVPTRLPIN